MALRRILVVDDNPQIHDDFRKVFAKDEQAPARRELYSLMGAILNDLSNAPAEAPWTEVEIDFAFQGEEACRLAAEAIEEERPYFLAFVDGRMPPGIDGVQTIKRLWRDQPELQCVLCTAYSDYDWNRVHAELAGSPNLLIIKKPFDPVEVLQVTYSLAEKQRLSEALRLQLRTLEERVFERTMAVEAANRAKSTFLANMSHEIRSPLTAIMGYADLLLNDATAPLTAEHRSWLETIGRNGEHLLNIVNDILDLSKVETGRMVAEVMPFSPRHLLSEVEALMQGRAAAKGVAFQVHFDSLLPETIHSDPTRLRQILINLIGNAIKFTLQGEVTLRVACPSPEADYPWLQMEVSDTGIGISDEQLRRLFQPFAQAEASTARQFGGTGLGLAISKSLANLLGGDITATSTPGSGSQFLLTIATGSLQGVRLMSADLEPPPSPVAKSPRNIPDNLLAGVHILLAEDGPDNQRLLRMLLRRAGAEVTVVENGQQALDLMLVADSEQAPFDLLLTDVQMPLVDGFELTTRLRDRGVTLPIVALTAHAMVGDREKCLQAGCNDYATKPVDKWSLLEVIHRWTVGQQFPLPPVLHAN
jgi:signal transduction histidine kinase/ActR/RegA family two-component response regulator